MAKGSITNDNIHEIVAKHDAEISQLSDGIKQLVENSKITNDAISKLSDKIFEKTSPNVGNMLMISAAWATVVLMVIFGIGTPLLYSMNESAARDRMENRQHFEDMDTKLQKEFALSLAATDKGIMSLDAISKERHDGTVKLFDVAMAAIDDVKQNGTPAMRERMARIEAELARQLDVSKEFTANGSPALRERIARLEANKK